MKNIQHLLTLLFVVSVTFLGKSQNGWQMLFNETTEWTEGLTSPIVNPDGTYSFLHVYGDSTVLRTVNEEREILSEYTYPDFINHAQIIDEDRYLLSGTQTNGFFLTYNNHIIKADQDGNTLWENDLQELDDENISTLSEIAEAGDGSFFILGSKRLASDIGYDSLVLARFNASGGMLWHKKYPENYIATGILMSNDGNLVVTGGPNNPSPDDDPATFMSSIHVMKIDTAGNMLWNTDTETSLRSMTENETGEIFYTYQVDEETENYRDAVLAKMSADGEILWQNVLERPLSSELTDIKEANEDGCLLSGVIRPQNNAFVTSLVMLKTDTEGNIIWSNIFEDTPPQQFFSTGGLPIVTLDKGFFAVGNYGALEYEEPYNRTLVALRFDSLGNLFPGSVAGIATFDDNENCLNDTDEILLSDWLVKVENEDFIGYGVVGEDGSYHVASEIGDMTVSLMPYNNYFSVCENDIPVSVETFTTETVDFSVQAVTDCPAMFIDISAPVIRRCFDTQYTVNYCNRGTIPAENSHAEIAFDEFLTVTGSSLPWSFTADEVYIFDLGTVGVQECGSFIIDVSVGCESDGAELGEVQCVTAHIYPDSLCRPVDPLWDGSDLIVGAECEEDSVRFFIRNIGEGDMQTPQEYIIIEDHIIFMQEPFDLPGNGGEIDIPVPTEGIAYRLETAQNPGHPIGNMPSVNVEGCNVDEVPDFLLDFWNSYPDDDISPFVSIDCQQIIGSYDPNDKRAFPTGYGAEHFIRPNTEIEYHIRFQNTGTDTAFTVVVEDVLSEHLDITTVRTGVGSHPFTFDIENDRRLTFTFDNILLPDSTTNEAASNGFVKFKVRQLPDNPIGTQIFNEAAIFFDFNAPIITNEVFHEIGENFMMNSVATEEIAGKENRVFVSPNPFGTQTRFVMDREENTPFRFVLYDVQGREIRRSTQRANSFIFRSEELNAGLYFYKIETESGVFGSGKIVLR